MLAVPQRDGRSYRDTLEPLARRGHAGAIKELEEKPLPDVLQYLWIWFLQLDGMRDQSMSGIAGFTPKNIQGWADLYDVHPKPYEIEGLMQLDRAFRKELMDGIEALRPPKK
jgi:hypothetical protein